MADDDGDDGDDGSDDGDDGDDDEADGDGPEGDARVMSRAESEAKSEQMDNSRSPNQTGDATGITRPPPSHELPPQARFNLSAPQPHPSHVEGSPLKHVISAQSPGSSNNDVASEGSAPIVMSTPPDGTEETHESMQPAISLPYMDVDVDLVGSSGDIDRPTTTGDLGQDFGQDTEMPDAATTFTHSLSAQNIETHHDPSARPVESSGISAVRPDTVGDEGQDEANGSKLSQETETTRNLGDEPPALEVAAVMGHPAEPAVSDATTARVEPPEAQAKDDSSFTGGNPTIPGLTVTQDDHFMLQTQEENEANSPDLFSSLEAALDQHGPVNK